MSFARSPGGVIGTRADPTNHFSEFVVKVHNGCQLACDYCYMYESVDQSWRAQPGRMSTETLVQVARRIDEHVGTSRSAGIKVIFHGGEPLLSGAASIVGGAELIRREVGSHVGINFSLQTNGALLTERVVSALAEAGINICVSLDGDQSQCRED